LSEFQHQGDAKKQFVQEMFDDISPRYDFLNHFLSFGIDIYWRHRLIRSIPDPKGFPILDVATGTGDVGIAIKRYYPSARVIGLDYAYRMTTRCLEKIDERRISDFEVLQGDGEKLPFPNASMAALTISFGFRNIGHYDEALREFHRILIPGGSLHILEFAEPEAPIFGPVYAFYFHRILPRIGALFSRSDAYRYLPESVEHFPPRPQLRSMLADSGFEEVRIRNLTFGTVTLITAQKWEKVENVS